jgi:hypothetical protein
MALENTHIDPYQAPRKRLEDSRCSLLCSNIQEENPVRRQLLLEHLKRLWPEEGRYLHEDIVPKYYMGKVETT